ncbi:hypothetical protein DPMN_096890 [Dreissena polymorpha]|uniref:Secreted protein n=1 Tax=Dreissena polymorpha TaxID=45954 RepID=A0A9D4LBY2_DREPO|nr:hypothetical protein DPMN_096890 [Dreissena polymorpha]
MACSVALCLQIPPVSSDGLLCCSLSSYNSCIFRWHALLLFVFRYLLYLLMACCDALCLQIPPVSSDGLLCCSLSSDTSCIF